VDSPRSSGNDLVASALDEERAEPSLGDEGHDWPAADEIGHSPEALPVARRLAASGDPVERAVAAHVLGAQVDGNPTHTEQAIALLAGMIPNAEDPHLEWSIADALRLSSDVRAVEPLVALAGSSSASTRRTVAMGLGAAMVDQLPAAGVETLIRLSADPNPTVRDWATFGLAELDENSPEVRSALWARVADPHYNTRCEALAGLAARGDEAVADRVRAELGANHVGRLVVRAAADLGDPSLLQPLLALRDWWDVDPPLLERAIRASGGESRPGG
jgi:HEAT repeat protein